MTRTISPLGQTSSGSVGGFGQTRKSQGAGGEEALLKRKSLGRIKVGDVPKSCTQFSVVIYLSLYTLYI